MAGVGTDAPAVMVGSVPEAVGPPPGVPGFRLLRLLEPARPPRIAASRRAAHLVVATVCVGAFMGQLDTSIVSVALPRLSSDLHVGIGAAEWVSLSYILALVVLVAPVGAWADAVGRKSLYVGGFAVFTAASAACAVAPDLPLLCLFRVVQAAGAALLQANSVALIADATPPGRLGRMIGVQAAAQAIGLAMGPAVGGALLAVGSWRLLFIVNVPAGLLGLATGALLLPRSRNLTPTRRLDVVGLALFVPAVGLALLALSLAAGPGGRAGVLVAGPLAVVAAVALVRQQRRSASPLVDRGILARRPFRRGLVAGLAGYAVLFGTLVVVPLFLAASHSPPARIGMILTALPVGIGVVAPVAGRWADRKPLLVPRAGLALAALALAGVALARPSGLLLAGLLAVLGAGLGAFTPANNRAVMLAAPTAAAGAAAGLLNMTRGMGTAAGTAIAVVSFTAASGAATGLAVAATALVLGCAVALAAVRAPRP